MRRALGRLALGTAVVFGLSVVAPVGAVQDPKLPVSWLWSWVGQRPAWAVPHPAVPQEQGGAGSPRRAATTADTTAKGGAGQPAAPVKNALPAYQPHDPHEAPQTTGADDSGFDPATSERSQAKSSQRTDVFTNADGTETTRTYQRPVNFRDKSGNWQPINSTLTKRTDGRLHAAANSIDASVATSLVPARTDVVAPSVTVTPSATPTPTSSVTPSATPSASVTPTPVVTAPPVAPTLAKLVLPTGESVGYSLTGAAPVTPTVAGTTATYPAVLPYTDLQLQTFDAGLKETLVLNSPQAASSWTFPLTLDGLTPRVAADGSIELLNAAGKAVAWFPHGSMQDSKVDPHSGAPASSGGVTFKLIQVGAGTALQVDADRAWLTDPARVYPVKVDPTTTTSDSGDVFVDNDPATTNQNGDNLPVGTYDGGTTKARSFMHLDYFNSDGFTGKHITKATLKLFLTWTYSCTVDRPFDVRAVNVQWTSAALTNGGWPGPATSDPIGTTTITDPGAACTNTGADRTQGKWINVSLNPVIFDNWSRGTGLNYGLALTASETDSAAWKRFTSTNVASGAYRPAVELTYAPNVAPQVDVRYPANNSIASTLTPELIVKGHDPDNWPAKGLTYTFTVLSADGKTTVATSPAVASSWTVPAGKLAWNTTYLYSVKANDGLVSSNATPTYAFSTPVPQPVVTSNLAQNGGKGFDSSIGNYTTSATDANVSSVGPALAITRNYNSLDTRHDTAFGTGWSSVLDAKATQVPDAAGVAQLVRVTYPTGEEVAFGRTATGTFVPPTGRFSTFVETKSGTTVTGYTLTDKDATVYTFGRAAAGGVFRLTAITDANARTLAIAYGADNNPATMTGASGRKLTLSWTTPAGATAPHVTSVATDPAAAANPSSANTWTYTYATSDQLSTVCQPNDAVNCWKYGTTWTSPYRNTLLNLDPEAYWPLDDTSGTVAKSAVLANAGVDAARYADVTLGQPGHLPSSTATVASFNGTSSYVQLPSNLLAGGQYQSISMWFKTATPGGVLFSYNGDPISKGTTTGDYTPALYIDKNGKLRSELWTGNAAAALNSNTVVTDNAWHHVVLSGAGGSQTLYLDGVAKGSLAGTIYLATSSSGANINIGAGFVGGSWPDHANTGVTPAKATFFTGQIDDVAFFNQTVDGARAALLNQAGRADSPVLNQVTRPGGGVTAKVTYDQNTGKVAQVVDENGGTWKLDPPKVAGSSLVYAASVLGAKPQDYWRFGDSDVTDAVDEVAGGTATYNNVTLNQPGKFPDATAASFNGTSSYVELPPEDIPTTGPNSVEMWFNMPSGNTKGGVLYSYQISATDEAATGGWTPALYVGTDGKLRGGLWAGSTAAQMVSPVTVNDGKWHHVVLAAGTAAQALYLDGNAVGALSGAISSVGAVHGYIGTGRWSGSWAAHGTADIGWFPGVISDVALYTATLSPAQVGTHFATAQQTVPVAMTVIAGVAQTIPMPVSQVVVTTPDNHTQVSSFDLVNGARMVAQTDEAGNTTKYGYDVGGYSSMVYDPNGALTQTLQDVRGNTIQSITCQNQAANRCSSVYLSYFPDATSTTLTPNPKNDLLLTMRDGRTTAPAAGQPVTDDRYLTTNAYDAAGNLTSVTDPLKRVTTTAYTTAASVAADGGTPPAGLPTKVTTPAGTTQTVTYFKSGDVAQVTEPGGKVTKFTYDALGQVLTETEVTAAYPAGVVTTHTYDKMGREVVQTDPPVTNRVTGAVHTQVSTSVYDVDGNVLQVRDEDSTGGDTARVEKHTYNAYGQEDTSTTPGGAQTKLEYDVLGRLVKQTSPDGTVTTNEYDPTGNLTKTWLKGWTGNPDAPTAAADLLVQDNTYDAAGRLSVETDAKGFTTLHTYTGNGLDATVTRSDGKGNTYVMEDDSYDLGGNLIQEVTNNGLTTVNHTYDAAGRETDTTADPGTGKLNRSSSATFDADDRVLSAVQKDASGTVLSKMESLYDQAGRAVAQVTYRSTGAVPVGRWKLADGAGLQAKDTAGNSPATATAGVTWETGHGGAADFDGAHALTTTGPVVDSARSFTVSAWLKLGAKNALQRAVSATGSQESPFDIAYDQAADRWRFLVVPDDTANVYGVAIQSTSVPALNTWTLVTGVYNAAAGTATIYVNGKAEKTLPAKAFGNSGPLVIGSGMWNGAQGAGWTGGVSDVQVYQDALSATDVAGINTATVPAASAGVTRTSYTYDESDQVTSVTDPNGNTSYVAYDEDGNAVKSIAPAAMAETASSGATLANAVTWTGYNAFGEQTDSKDALGNWSSTFYDADGRTTLQRMPSYTPPGTSTPLVPETLSSYTTSGQVRTTTDPDGNITTYDYDQLDRLTKVTAANGAVTRYTYDELGNQLTMTSPTGAVSASTYDFLGRQATATDAVRQDGSGGAAYTTAFTYAEDKTAGRSSTTAASPRGVTSKTTYNALGDPIIVEDGAHNLTTTTYDGAGQPIRTTLPDSTYSTTAYDLAGQALSSSSYDETGALLQTRSSEYDAAGNLVAAVDGRKTRTTYAYDATGMMIAEHQPINAADAIDTSFGYDLEGNQTRFTDGRGNAFWTTYNSWGLPESQIEPSTAAHPSPADRTFTTSYDKSGRAAKLVQPGGVTVSNTYDVLGQLKTQSGSGAEAATTDRSFDYDLGGRMTKFSGDTGTNTVTYDDRDNPRSITGPSGNTAYTYDADGNLAGRDDAAGSTTFHYDTAGRLDQLANTTKGVSETLGYNTLNSVTKITYGTNGNSRNFTYDKLHRLTADELKTGSGTSLAKIAYGWNANDDMTSKTTTNFGGKTTANVYDYDLADRLTSWNDGAATTVYAYDKSGNRVQNGSKLFTYDARNRLLTGDGASYAYTARGTLSGSGGNQTKSDAFGQVITQTYAGGGSTKTYRYDGMGRVMQDGFAYSGTDNDLATDGTSTFVRGAGNEVVAEANTAGTRLAWTDLHNDIVGQFTPTGTALDASTVYDPLGKVIATAGAMVGSLGYQSEWTDNSTNRVNMMARWYNTDTGQFDTRDSASNSPAPASVTANRYQYGDANPLTVTDPSGHSGWGFIKRVAHAVASTVTSTSTYRAVSSYTSSAYNSASESYHAATSFVRNTYHAAVNKVSKVYHQAKKIVHHAYHAVKKRVHKYASAIKRHVKKAIAKVKKKVVKFAKAAYHKAAKITKAVVKIAKQAGKAAVAGAKRVVKDPLGAVKDAAKATKQFVVTHKDALIEIAAVGVGILAGMACTAITASAGAVACMIGASALVNLTKDALEGNVHSLGDALGSLGTGALQGLAGGVGGAVAGRLGTMVAGKVGSGLMGRLATEAVENGVDDVINQAVTTGRVNPKSAMMGMIPGLGAVERKSHGAGGTVAQDARKMNLIGGAGGGTRCHSFAPDTKVLMGDRSQREIKDINVGDQVLSADPKSSGSKVETVTQLHRNTDHDLTKVTVKDQNNKKSVLNTTQNHPFWDATDRKWTDAKNLKPGHHLRVVDQGDVTVTRVANTVGTHEMRDLTVDNFHTYYVMAGDTPVLVHNCGGGLNRLIGSLRNKANVTYLGRLITGRPMEPWRSNRVLSRQLEGEPAPANATVRDLVGMQNGNGAIGYKVADANGRSDEDLLASVFNPQDGQYIATSASRPNVIAQGNHRATQLIARALNPLNDKVNLDTEIFIHRVGQ